jgi:hypothetical protein
LAFALGQLKAPISRRPLIREYQPEAARALHHTDVQVYGHGVPELFLDDAAIHPEDTPRGILHGLSAVEILVAEDEYVVSSCGDIQLVNWAASASNNREPHLMQV